MDSARWNRLTNSEKKEVKSMGSAFTEGVFNSNSIDGRDFYNKYEIRKIDDVYCIFEKSTNSIFGDFKSKSQKVIDALMTDATQNYGR